MEYAAILDEDGFEPGQKEELFADLERCRKAIAKMKSRITKYQDWASRTDRYPGDFIEDCLQGVEECRRLIRNLQREEHFIYSTLADPYCHTYPC